MRASVNEISTFCRCRRKWKYSSFNMMNLQAKEEKAALFLGTGIHKALELYYGEGKDTVETFKEWFKKEETVDTDYSLYTLGVAMLENYKDCVIPTDDFEVIAVEHEFEYPWATHYFVGKMDGIVRDKDGIWVLEHKTFTSPPTEDYWAFDLQTMGYPWVLSKLVAQGKIKGVKEDEVVKGVLYNGLRKKVPTKPEVLKNGKSLSKNMAIDTTAGVYLAAILKNGFNPSDYTEILTALHARGNQFFKRVKIRRSEAEYKHFENMLTRLIPEMALAKEQHILYPTLTYECRSLCGYNKLCASEMQGGDTLALIKELYKQESKGGVYENTDKEKGDKWKQHKIFN